MLASSRDKRKLLRPCFCNAHSLVQSVKHQGGLGVKLGILFKKNLLYIFFFGGVHQNSETAILRLLFLDLRKAPQNPGAGTLGLWSLSNFPPKKAGNQREPLSQRSVMPLPKPLRPLARIAQKSPHMRFSSRWGRWLEKDSIRDFKRWTFVCCQPWRNEFYHIK